MLIAVLKSVLSQKKTGVQYLPYASEKQFSVFGTFSTVTFKVTVVVQQLLFFEINDLKKKIERLRFPAQSSRSLTSFEAKYLVLKCSIP